MTTPQYRQTGAAATAHADRPRTFFEQPLRISPLLPALRLARFNEYDAITLHDPRTMNSPNTTGIGYTMRLCQRVKMPTRRDAIPALDGAVEASCAASWAALLDQTRPVPVLNFDVPKALQIPKGWLPAHRRDGANATDDSAERPQRGIVPLFDGSAAQGSSALYLLKLPA